MTLDDFLKMGFFCPDPRQSDNTHLPPQKSHDHVVTIDYTNWQGERRLRRIRPIQLMYVSTPHHQKEQWVLQALDLDKDALRMFSIKDIHRWEEP